MSLLAFQNNTSAAALSRRVCLTCFAVGGEKVKKVKKTKEKLSPARHKKEERK